MEGRRRAKSMDSGGVNVLVPNTPVPDGISNGEVGNGLELIG